MTRFYLALGQPVEESSREGFAAALLLASVAWNRVVSPDGGDRVGRYLAGASLKLTDSPIRYYPLELVPTSGGSREPTSVTRVIRRIKHFLTMDSYKTFIDEFTRLMDEGKRLPLGSFEPPSHSQMTVIVPCASEMLSGTS